MCFESADVTRSCRESYCKVEDAHLGRKRNAYRACIRAQKNSRSLLLTP